MTGSTGTSIPPTNGISSTASSRAPRQSGKVAWFNNDKGWGFLTPDAGGADVFVHYTGIRMKRGKGRRTLQETDLVEFEVVTGSNNKPQAIDVAVVGQAPIEESAAAN
jgi:CspA family cold shock protein